MRRSPSAMPSLPKFLTLILCVLIFSTLSLAAAPDRIAGPIDSSQTVALAKSHHPKAQPQYDRGPVDPSFKLGYVTLLMSPSPSQQKALDQLLEQQQDPTSPLYHKWLTPQQYADRFGLSPNDLSKVTAWLKSEGFQIVGIGGGRNTVIFSGTAAQAQHAFGTEIHKYQVDGAEHFANSTPLMVPAALRGIVTSVMGLHNFLPHPAHRPRHVGATDNARPAYYDGNYIFPNYLAPGDIYTIYDIGKLHDAGYDGTGQTLAIVGQTDIYLDDITDFRTGFNLPAITNCTANGNGILISCTSGSDTDYLQYVLIGTDPGVPSAGDLSESDLDIEWSGAAAREAKVIFVNAETTNGVYDALVAVIDPASFGLGTTPLSTVVSMSYGECEFDTYNLEPVLEEGNALGVTIMNSAGDEASAGCDYDPPGTSNTGVLPPPPYAAAEYGLAVSYPASSPEVTGVGGTAISLANDSYPSQSSYWGTTIGANGGTAVSYIPETPWNDDEEWADYCHAPAAGDPFCEYGTSKHVEGWVALGSSATAKQVQEDIWIDGGGGGASNCWYENSDNVCLGAGAGPSGGGFAQPLYQQGLSVTGAPTRVRYVPDVSLLASPNFPGYIWCTPLSELGEGGSTSSCASGIFDAVNTYESLVGGTSVSSPIFAGIVTLLNQYVVANKIQSAAGLGNINTRLYDLALSNSTNKVFNQITTGDNTVYCQVGTPSGFPSNIVCPNAGSFGYEASNYDSKTGYNLVTGLGSVDAYNLVTSFAQTGSSTSTAVACSPNPANFGAEVTCTATVTTTGSTPLTGTVTIYDGTTVLGSGTLSGGATAFALSTSSLTLGTHSITAVYGGDSANGGSTSPVLSQVIVAAPTFTFTASSTSHTVLAGQTTLGYSFTATPTGTTSFAGQVTFNCSFAPTDTTLTNASCAFNPPSIAAGTIAPTGVAVGLFITTTGPNTGNGTQLRRRVDNRSRSPWLPLTLPIAGVVVLGLMRGKVSGKVSKRSAVALALFMLALIGFMAACGGGGGSTTPPASVSVTPSTTVQLYANESGNSWAADLTQQQFTAVVNNSSSQTVSWAVTGASANGTIGTTTGLYTTPATVPSPATVTVTATSSAATTPGTGTVDILTPTGDGALPAHYTVTVTATETGAASPQTAQVTLIVN